MVLRPLEFSDCISDSPWFRQNLHDHEHALEEAYKNIKNIENQCRELINCTKKLAVAQRSFAKSLREFNIETVGMNQTDDERVISTCLKEYGTFIDRIEDERAKIVDVADVEFINKLKKFRVEVIGRALNEEKRKYEKESNKFYSTLEKHLHLSTMRRNDFREADAQLYKQQKDFFGSSLQYVAEIQSVQERFKFEFVDTLSSFLHNWLSFYHVGHTIYDDFKPFLSDVSTKVQKTQENYLATQAEAQELKDKMLKSHTKIAGQASNSLTDGSAVSIKQGYVFLQEKTRIPKTIGRDVLGKWTKYYCVYFRETRIFSMITANTAAKTDMKAALGQSVSLRLTNCSKRTSDSIDRRFCFEVTVEEKPDPMTFQALSEVDLNEWIDSMDNTKTSVFPTGSNPSCSTYQQTQLDEIGFDFVRQCIRMLEDNNRFREQGVYRNCGVTSKVQKMMQLGLDRRKATEKTCNFGEEEWETKTISSAVKTFLRNLPEPLMTFKLHNEFINAAKMGDAKCRIDHIHFFVHQLPEEHKRMLEMVIEHLNRVAKASNENLMTVSNLGVCFGPTLLRPKEETMAAIMDIKFCNVVVEVLISEYEKIFNSPPPTNIKTGPAKPEHNQTSSSSSSSAANNGESSSMAPSPATRIRTLQSELTPAARGCVKVLRNTQNTPVLARSTRSDGETRLFQTSFDVASTSGGPSPTLSPICGDKTLLAESSTGATSSSSTTTPPTLTVDETATAAVRTRDSSDSLNSLASVGSTAEGGVVEKRAIKGKMSTSYAPTYQKNPNESFDDGLFRHRNSQLSAAIHCSTTALVSRRVKTLYSCTPDHDSELSFGPGQIITNVYESKEDGWLVGTLNGKTGLIPANYVEALP